jgi:hypothetical protein
MPHTREGSGQFDEERWHAGKHRAGIVQKHLLAALDVHLDQTDWPGGIARLDLLEGDGLDILDLIGRTGLVRLDDGIAPLARAPIGQGHPARCGGQRGGDHVDIGTVRNVRAQDFKVLAGGLNGDDLRLREQARQRQSRRADIAPGIDDQAIEIWVEHPLKRFEFRPQRRDRHIEIRRTRAHGQGRALPGETDGTSASGQLQPEQMCSRTQPYILGDPGDIFEFLDELDHRSMD